LLVQGAVSVVQSRVEDLSPVVKKGLGGADAGPREGRAGSRLHLRLRTVKLKGYRQGHVPRRLVERYFGDDVKRTSAQKLVTGSIHEALAEHQLDPVAPPRVEKRLGGSGPAVQVHGDGRSAAARRAQGLRGPERHPDRRHGH